MTGVCHCCGRPGHSMCNLAGGGRIHFDCWDEHHSDPTTEWPVGHVCKMRAVAMQYAPIWAPGDDALTQEDS